MCDSPTLPFSWLNRVLKVELGTQTPDWLGMIWASIGLVGDWLCKDSLVLGPGLRRCEAIRTNGDWTRKRRQERSAVLQAVIHCEIRVKAK